MNLTKKNEETKDELLLLEHNNVNILPDNAITPMFFLPTADDRTVVAPCEDDPFMAAAREYLKFNAKIHKYSTPANLNYINGLSDQFYYNLKTNCNAIFIQDIILSLIPFKSDSSNTGSLQAMAEDMTMFCPDLNSRIKEIVTYIFLNYIDCPDDPSVFIGGMSEIKAFISYFASKWTYEYINRVFMEEHVSAYGYSCYIASCTGLNVNSPSCPFNVATAYSFAVQSCIALASEAVHKMSEAAEVGFVSLFYNMREYVNENIEVITNNMKMKDSEIE